MSIKVHFTIGSVYAADLAAQFGALFSDGVLSGGAVTEHSPANLSVNVAAVKGLKSGLFMNSDAVENVAITSNTSGYGRIDTIALDMDNGTIVAVAGTPSSSPTAPVLTGNKLALANVAVGNNVSVINTANITDVREYVCDTVDNGDTTYTTRINGLKRYSARFEVLANSTTVHMLPDGLFSEFAEPPQVSMAVPFGDYGTYSTGLVTVHSYSTSSVKLSNWDSSKKAMVHLTVMGK